MADSEK
ncbi:unnamed protein product, partial [Allacma fusca]